MSAAEDLNDWEIVDPITPPQNFEDASARLDEGLGSSSSASEPQPKHEQSPKPSNKFSESKIHQRSTTPPIRGTLVARAVQMIEQAISDEAEKPYTHEGSCSRQTWEHIRWRQDR
jgi:predicted metalloenzyme YecM